ncbi:MAG: SAM-dependent chlorinase/fluorinase, partial [Halobacteria archaeon]|nr:SAM-dependent chlorinase/fluorinase [Halobacteria archaeon]
QSDARIHDIYHAVPPQNVRAGAFILSNVAPYFPAGTVHCVVIDPGVGTDRRAIAVEADDQYFVGPDNGVLVPPARELSDNNEIEVYNVPYDDETESNTFHGRDVFAPAAASIAEGGDFRDNPIDDYVDLNIDFYGAEFDGSTARAEVVYVDRFGNVITDLEGGKVLERADYGDVIHVNRSHLPFEDTYARVPEGKPLCTVGSHGNFEVSVNQGSGSKALSLEAGDEVEIEIE